MAFETYQKVVGTIQNIRIQRDCCMQTVSIMSEQGMVDFIVAGDTKVIDNVRLRRGMRVAAFYDGALPVPAIYPPQYRAELITALRRDQEVMLSYFDRSLTSADRSLRLNINPRTNIETSNGQRFTCSPANAELLVYYTITTFSIPAQTSPQRIIVLC